MSDKDEILNLRHGECYIVPESDYGKAEVWRINNMYFLFSIPTFGGEPAFEKAFHIRDLDNLIKTYERWT